MDSNHPEEIRLTVLIFYVGEFCGVRGGVRRGAAGSSVLVTWIVARVDVSKGIESTTVSLISNVCSVLLPLNQAADPLRQQHSGSTVII